eukprot:353082-Chlamydomonas_euryale.AAC.1
MDRGQCPRQNGEGGGEWNPGGDPRGRGGGEEGEGATSGARCSYSVHRLCRRAVVIHRNF